MEGAEQKDIGTAKAFESTKKDTIIIAEDNSVNQKVLQSMVSRNCPSIRVLLAKNGLEAVQQCSQEHARLALILMDIQMPGMDGLDATRSIREMEGEMGLPRVPIVALGTRGAKRAPSNTWQVAGMDTLITKPVRVPELLRITSQFGVVETAAPLEKKAPGNGQGTPPLNEKEVYGGDDGSSVPALKRLKVGNEVFIS